jgi:hypothetical protein
MGRLDDLRSKKRDIEADLASDLRQVARYSRRAGWDQDAYEIATSYQDSARYLQARLAETQAELDRLNGGR